MNIWSDLELKIKGRYTNKRYINGSFLTKKDFVEFDFDLLNYI